jgi:hypothetical protein
MECIHSQGFLVGGELLQPEIIYSSSLEVVRRNRVLFKRKKATAVKV